jgi:4-hydroxyphenylpyruvate dioxygenase-like putative hemolysin
MLRTPDGEANIKLVKFHTPSDEKGMQRPLANTLGIRHIAFAVEDIEAIVAKLKENGAATATRQPQHNKKLINFLMEVKTP